MHMNACIDVCMYIRVCVCVNKCVLLYTRAAYGTRVYVRLCAHECDGSGRGCIVHLCTKVADQAVALGNQPLRLRRHGQKIALPQIGWRGRRRGAACMANGYVCTVCFYVQGMCEVARAREKEFVKLLACRWLHPSTRVRHV